MEGCHDPRARRPALRDVTDTPSGGRDRRTDRTTKTIAASGSTTDIATIAFAAILGLGLIFAAGFSQAGAMHDVAHDSRHATGFPCH